MATPWLRRSVPLLGGWHASDVRTSWAAALLALPALLLISGSLAAADDVVVVRLPGGGVQPQAMVDGAGVEHVIWCTGDPTASDIQCATLTGDGFSAPIRINSQPGSAIAIGTVRGPHLAIGRGGRVDVAWMGSQKAVPRAPDGSAPFLFATLDTTSGQVSPQRNLITWAPGLDGGGSIAADRRGHVWAAWHASAGKGTGQGSRAVCVARSDDDGRTFAKERRATQVPTGACGCCGMRAGTDADGDLVLLYRQARDDADRGMVALLSRDLGTDFATQVLSSWTLNTCPMSTCAVTAAGGPGSGDLLAWQSQARIYFARTDRARMRVGRAIVVPGTGAQCNHPTIAVNAAGEILVAWTEGTGWNQGGSVAWQHFDAAMKPLGPQGRGRGLPAWDLAAAVARPDGSFAVIY